KKYGFRTVPDEKQAHAIAEAQGFKSTSATLPTGSWQPLPPPMLRRPAGLGVAPPTPPLAPQGWAATFQKAKEVVNDVKEAAVAVAQDQLTTMASDIATRVLGSGSSGGPPG